MRGTRKISDIYFDLFDMMMNYNHKLWRKIALPLPLNHIVVIYFLYNNKNATISEIAGHLSISKQQMSPIVDKLLKKGFIKKRCLSNDRRFSQIYLSDEGKKFFEEHQQKQRDNFVQYITDLSDSDAERFDESVKIVKLMISKMFDTAEK